jgi:replication factor C small subunit
MSNMILCGIQGSGKTTLAELICKEMKAVKLFVPCGTNGNIDTVRTTITEFAQSRSIDDEIKIIILDEFDSASGALACGVEDDGKANNNTMKAMRSLIEEHQDDTRFILTCNYLNKIIGPIQSRCPPIRLKFSHKDVLLRVIDILKKECITYTKESVTQFLEVVIKKNFPDIRKIISILQSCCSSGELIVNGSEESTTTIETFAKEVLEKIKTNKPQEVRQHIMQNKHIFNEEYNKLATTIFNICMSYITVEKAKVLIEYIYRIDHVIDPEIQFFGMLLELY